MVRLGALVLTAMIVAGCASSPAPPAPVSRPSTPVAAPATAQLEQVNADGVAVRLVKVAFEADRILVDLEVRNGSGSAVTLASSPYTGMTLVDDLGGSYNFLVPEGNKALRVEAGTSYAGQVAFAGPVGPSARTLTLVTNAGAAPDRFVPRFEFAAIPVA